MTVTRFYFPNGGTAPSVTPAVGSQWDVTPTGFGRSITATTKAQNTTVAAEASNPNFGETSASVVNVIHRQWVCTGTPLNAGVLSGNFSAVMRGGEDSGTNDAALQVVIRVVSSDGLTERGVLYAGQTAALNTTAGALGQEWATSSQTRIIPSGTPLTPVTVQTGDLLVIEFGHRHYNTLTTNATGWLAYGDTTANSDLPLTAGDTTLLNPWLEFDFDIFNPPTVVSSTDSETLAENRRDVAPTNQTLLATKYAGGTTTVSSGGGTWANTANATGSTAATFATFTSSVSSDTGTLDLTTYDFSAIPAGATIVSVAVSVANYQTTTSRSLAAQFQCYDGATALGTLHTGTLTSTTTNVDTFTETSGITLANLQSANFKVRFIARKAAATQSGVQNLDYIGVAVTYAVAGTIQTYISSPDNIVFVDSSSVSSAGSTTPTANDTETGSEDVSVLQAGVPTTDQHTVTEQTSSVVVVLTSTVETETLNESTSQIIIASTETETLAEGASSITTVTTTVGDPRSVTDVSSLVAIVPVSDAAATTEGASSILALNLVSTTDSETLAESPGLVVTAVPTTDSETLSEVDTTSYVGTASDAVTATDAPLTGVVVGTVVDAETLSEVVTVLSVRVSTDTDSLADSSAVALSSTSVDSGSTTDPTPVIVVQPQTVDSGTVTDISTMGQILVTASDQRFVADSASVPQGNTPIAGSEPWSQAEVVSDIIITDNTTDETLSESVTILSQRTSTDGATLSDASSSMLISTRLDSISVTEGNTLITIFLTRADSETLTSATSLNIITSPFYLWNGTSQILLNVAGRWNGTALEPVSFWGIAT